MKEKNETFIGEAFYQAILVNNHELSWVLNEQCETVDTTHLVWIDCENCCASLVLDREHGLAYGTMLKEKCPYGQGCKKVSVSVVQEKCSKV
jgi:hypothetical protein